MTIKYKFNKSSEARDCVVKSVELETSRITKKGFEEQINFEQLKYSVNGQFLEAFQEELHEDFNEIDTAMSLFHTIYEKIQCDDLGHSHKDYNYYEGYVWISNVRIEIKYLYSHGFGSMENEEINIYREIKDEIIEEKLKFDSSDKLKNYINLIQEPIEFIAESDIDQVLMKEWIGKWKTEYIPFINIRKIIGSPKFNSNWTFKIK